MLLFVLLQGAAAVYGAAYLWHCIRRSRPLAACGAALLCLCGLAMGTLMALYVV